MEHKAFIRYEYLVKDTSLKDLIGLLAGRGHDTTKARLEYRLKLWRFSKNLDQEIWRSISRKVKRRKDIGKDSEVIYNGNRIEKSKVIKETARHRKSLYNELALRPRSPSPTNPRLVVCSPSPIKSDTIWPQSLPWLRLRDVFWDVTASIINPSATSVYQTRDTYVILSMMLKIWRKSETSSLPSSFQDLATVSILLDGQSSEIVSEYFKIMMYGLSNGTKNIERVEWDMFTSMLRRSMSDIRMNLRQLRSHNVTIRAFFEKVFQAEIYWATKNDNLAIDHRDYLPDKSLDIIKLLLESGQDPNCCVSGCTGDYVTPIGRALNVGHVDLARLLLDFHIRINDIQAEFDQSNAIQAILHGHTSNAVRLRLLKLLQEYKAISLEEILCGALKLHDMELIEQILQEDINVTKGHTEWQRRGDDELCDIGNCLGRESPLTTSLGVNCHFTKRLLDHPSVQEYPSQVLSAEIFIAAAIRGDYDIIRQLQGLCPSGLACKWRDITCLRAAVAYNNLPVAQFLLEPNGVASSDLILIAACYGYENMVRLLLQHALSPDEPINEGDVQWLEVFAHETLVFRDPYSILQVLLGPRATDWIDSEVNCLTVLIEAGARFLGGEISLLAENGLQDPLEAALSRNVDPNDQDEDGRTAIQCALYPDMRYPNPRSRDLNTRHQIIKALLEAGAKQVGGEVVHAIRDRDYNLTKLLLKHGGSLKGIDGKGASCLEALIINFNGILFERACARYYDIHYPSFQRETMISDSNISNREIVLDLFEAQDDATMACPNCTASELDSDSDERDCLQELIEAQDDAIDAGPICAAIQVRDWDLLDRLLIRPHKETNCHLLEGTAIGLAAKAGQMRILEKLLGRFPHPSALQSGFIPLYVVSGNLMFLKRDKNLERFEWDTYIDDAGDFWRTNQSYASREISSPLVLAGLGADASGFEALLSQGCCADKATVTIVAQREIASAYLGLLKQHNQQLDNLAPSQSALCSILLGPIRHGNIELLKELVDAGTDVNDYDAAMHHSRSALQLAIELGHSRGATALQFAAIKGHMGIAKLLMDRGARINARGSRRWGRTALEGAAEHGRLDMLELILQSGAAWADSGRQQFISAVRLAMKNAHYAAVDWLKDRYGWTEEDKDFLNNGRDGWKDWDERCKNCRHFCCDEIHGSEEDCIHYYPDDTEQEWVNSCPYCGNGAVTL
ncbi:hypothetical protein FOMG_18248 [Fusarium oxysporum f. sp. melonis 26406]|uniref:Uncharacterized protein n=1 Tax=Fusarium oxysporum f. sp. melonis 26406 TaxID=1089452 RepID=W9Z124_FUSOX|nr:hypothetical protein FOMG_18248 [Fusarium oxysporum f. sp. melonis 26406]